MWGRRRRRCVRLPRQLALGLLEDAMGRVQQPEEPGESEPAAPDPGPVPAPAPAQDERTGESTHHDTFF
jgi:hypothetical protein